MAKGRKRKNVKREPNGRKSRKGEPRNAIDRGSDWAQARIARFGTYYNSAIGRAFAAGLLGDGNEAKDRYDKARKFSALYGAVIGRDRYRCALNDSPRGSSERIQTFEDVQREAEDQNWLIVNAARIDLTGCRPFFDQLISGLYTDYGPSWLDAILDAKNPDRRDTIVLDAALRAIDAIKPATGARIVLLHNAA